MYVLDSCVVKHLISCKRFDLLNGLIMDFQKSELSEGQLNLFKRYGTVLEPFPTEQYCKGDSNFLLLENSGFKIVTYDKVLKRLLLNHRLLAPMTELRKYHFRTPFN